METAAHQNVINVTELYTLKYKMACFMLQIFYRNKKFRTKQRELQRAGAWTQGLEVEGLEVEICELLQERDCGQDLTPWINPPEVSAFSPGGRRVTLLRTWAVAAQVQLPF